jgi:hypothetical protein
LRGLAFVATSFFKDYTALEPWIVGTVYAGAQETSLVAPTFISKNAHWSLCTQNHAQRTAAIPTNTRAFFALRLRLHASLLCPVQPHVATASCLLTTPCQTYIQPSIKRFQTMCVASFDMFRQSIEVHVYDAKSVARSLGRWSSGGGSKGLTFLPNSIPMGLLHSLLVPQSLVVPSNTAGLQPPTANCGTRSSRCDILRG